MGLATTVTLKFNGTAVAKGLASIKKGFANLAQTGLSAFKSMLSPLAKIAALLGPTAIVAGVVKLGKDSSEAAANFENMKAQFELFTGSVAKSQKLIEDLRGIAIKSPLELSDISDGARMLLTYGVAAEEVTPIVDRLSEVSAGSAERFQRISYAFGQISSMGRLMGTELRQRTEAGFNPLEMISKRTGQSLLVLKKRMEDGGISIDEVKLALKDATAEGGRFYGLNEKMSQTFSGRVSMMRDQWGRLLVDLGEGLNDGMKVAVDSLTKNMPALSEKFKMLGGIIGPAIAEAVVGDFDRFVKIGNLIGEAMKIGLSTAWQGIGTYITKKWAETTKENAKMLPGYGMGLGALSEKVLEMSEGVSSGELLAANIQNSKISKMMDDLKKSAIIKSETSGYRMANEGESSMFSDASGRKVIQQLQGQVPGTSGKYRYAQEGERSVFSDSMGNKIIKILESVDRRLQPQL